MLKYITCGESHGEYLAAIVEGMPSGLSVDLDYINGMLSRRQQGYGRGGRQRIEKDTVRLLGGVVKGLSTGAPIGLFLANKDVIIDKLPELMKPRPGHADLAGALKYGQGIRPVLERASARETAMRVAVGGLASLFLREFGIEIVSHVVRIGAASVPAELNLTGKTLRSKIENSPMRCVFPEAEKAMIRIIDRAKEKKDTAGGCYEVRICGVPPGLGSYVHFERKLDARLAFHLMSMQSVKAVEIGDGTRLSQAFGSEAHDEIFYGKGRGYYRKTNRAGGIEGGMSNGEDIVARVTMKPIATLGQPLRSVHMRTRKPEKASFERSDICAVPAGSLIGSMIAAFVIAEAFLEKFGGDSMSEIRRNYEGYLKQVRRR